MNPTKVDWRTFRDQMPVARNWAYFDHAAVAPLPDPARQAIARWAGEAAEQGDAVWPSWAARVEEVRKQAASLIGAGPDEIALVPNTTAGLSMIASGIDWRAGDNVVTLSDEFPSNRLPWLNLAAQGVETRLVAAGAPDAISGHDSRSRSTSATVGEVDLGKIEAACDERTRLISVSWVNYLTGFRVDLDAMAALARRRGAALLIDAIQGLGVFPIDVARTDIDFLAADGHKWLLGPEGAGVLFIRRSWIERLRPWGVGWHSVERSHDFTQPAFRLRTDAARWEGGSANMPGLHGLGASLDLLRQFGAGPSSTLLADRVTTYASAARHRLLAAGALVVGGAAPRLPAGIVSFQIPRRDPKMVRQRCLDARIVLSVRGEFLRISPHVYNNDEDLDRLCEVVAAV